MYSNSRGQISETSINRLKSRLGRTRMSPQALEEIPFLASSRVQRLLHYLFCGLTISISDSTLNNLPFPFVCNLPLPLSHRVMVFRTHLFRIIYPCQDSSPNHIRVELVKDREAWYTAVPGVAKSWTRLSDWTIRPFSHIRWHSQIPGIKIWYIWDASFYLLRTAIFFSYCNENAAKQTEPNPQLYEPVISSGFTQVRLTLDLLPLGVLCLYKKW